MINRVAGVGVLLITVSIAAALVAIVVPILVPLLTRSFALLNRLSYGLLSIAALVLRRISGLGFGGASPEKREL